MYRLSDNYMYVRNGGNLPSRNGENKIQTPYIPENKIQTPYIPESNVSKISSHKNIKANIPTS